MGKFIDLTGNKYGSLTVISREPNNKYKRSMWLCNCECGSTGVFSGNELVRGNLKSCGCLNRYKKSSKYTVKHPLYSIWSGMKQRCYNEKSGKNYKNYGGRGITVCERWKNSFENFLEDMGERPEGMTLDRRDPNGNYEPSNCRWVTNQQNCFNTRSKSNGSKYKGVSWHKSTNKWQAGISMNKVTKYLGVYSSEEEAALAYNKAALELFGEFAYLNIIET